MWIYISNDEIGKIATEQTVLAAIFMSISAAIPGSTELFRHTSHTFLHSHQMVRQQQQQTFPQRFCFPSLYGTRRLPFDVVCIVTSIWALRIQWTRLTWSQSYVYVNELIWYFQCLLHQNRFQCVFVLYQTYGVVFNVIQPNWHT